jgi:WD40 repeat protein
LALPSLTLDKKKVVETVAVDALQAFISMANVDPLLYTDFITSQVNSTTVPSSIICSAITSLYPLMHKYPNCLIEKLDVIINLILKVLDPHNIPVRDACLNSATNILRYMVEVYPMVSFHQENQKLTVGTKTGSIIIYDIKTASKWQQFDAYKEKEVNALIFSPLGDKIASYCETDGTCNVWNIDSNNVLNFFGVSSRQLEVFKVNAEPAYKINDPLKHASVSWKSSKYIVLKLGSDLNEITFTTTT